MAPVINMQVAAESQCCHPFWRRGSTQATLLDRPEMAMTQEPVNKGVKATPATLQAAGAEIGRQSTEQERSPMGRIGVWTMYLWKIPDDYPEALIGTYDKSGSPDRFLR
jgi:hypothetical protein